MSATKKFLQNVKKHQETKKVDKFRGFLEDYLTILEKDQNISVLSHQRLYNQPLDDIEDSCYKYSRPCATFWDTNCCKKKYFLDQFQVH